VVELAVAQPAWALVRFANELAKRGQTVSEAGRQDPSLSTLNALAREPLRVSRRARYVSTASGSTSSLWRS
jgi:hypothetical protein